MRKSKSLTVVFEDLRQPPAEVVPPRSMHYYRSLSDEELDAEVVASKSKLDSLSAEQRREGESEGHGSTHISHVQHGRRKNQTWILQEGVQVLPVCRGAWTTKYAPFAMSASQPGRRRSAGIM